MWSAPTSVPTPRPVRALAGGRWRVFALGQRAGSRRSFAALRAVIHDRRRAHQQRGAQFRKPTVRPDHDAEPGHQHANEVGACRGLTRLHAQRIFHARSSGQNTLPERAGCQFVGRALEDRLFLEASAGISQRTIDPFGTQSQGTGLVNDNSTEVYDLSISPSFRSRLGSFAEFRASAGWSTTAASSTDLGDNTTLDAAVGLSGGQGRWGWGLDATWSQSDYDASRRTTDDLVFATLRYAPTYDLQLSVRGGIEGQDVRTGQRQTTEFYGFGINWQPSPRTSLSYQRDERYFGRSHNFSFQYRRARSIWSYTDSRGINDEGAYDPLYLNQGASVSNYDLFYALFRLAGARPALREQLVLSFLQANGIDPNAAVSSGFLNSGQTVQRSQNLSVALLGQRTTVTLSAFATDTEPVETADITTGDLADVGRVRQLGYTAGVSHRLTPTSSVGLTASLLRTLDEPGQAGNEERLLTLNWSGQIGYRTFASASVRRTVFSSTTNPYNESAINASVRWEF